MFPSGNDIVAEFAYSLRFFLDRYVVDVEEGEIRSGFVGLPNRKDKAVFLVKFAPKVLERDAELER